MARRPTLNLVFAPEAVTELADIWRWNAEHYAPEHADHYVDFLKQVILRLARSYSRGKQISARPELRYILIRRKPKGHGHIAVYRFNEKTVDILHIFHSAQDWPSKVVDEEPGE